MIIFNSGVGIEINESKLLSKEGIPIEKAFVSSTIFFLKNDDQRILFYED